MFIKGILCLTTTVITLGSSASVLAQQMARPDPMESCDYISYIVREDGICIDLSALTEKGTLINNSLSLKFMRTLRAKGIKITNFICEEEASEEKWGSYQVKGTKRTLNLCKARIDLANRDELYTDDYDYIDTIAHESVHAIQHCLGNSIDDPNLLTPIATYEPELWDTYRSILGYDGMQQVLEDYDDASNPRNDHTKEIEVEAWALAQKPELVLELLKDLC